MKYLIIHPQDPTTSFLSQIYAPIKNKTVITGGITKYELRKLISTHDKVFMFGHGSPFGLLSVGQFPDSGLYLVNDMMYRLFTNKTGNIFIWCHADEYVKRYQLDGLYCGMMISEISESYYCGFREIKESWIDESNMAFASIMAIYINLPQPVLYKKLINEYGLLAKTNPIAAYNLERLYFSSHKTNGHVEKGLTCRIDRL